MTVIYISKSSLLLCLNSQQQHSESCRTAWQLLLRRQKNNKEKNHGMSLLDKAGGAHFECAPHFELLKLTTRCRFSGDLLSANVVQSQLEIAA